MSITAEQLAQRIQECNLLESNLLERIFSEVGGRNAEVEDFEKELKLDFLDEATQLIETIEQAFLALENDMENKSLIDYIFSV